MQKYLHIYTKKQIQNFYPSDVFKSKMEQTKTTKSLMSIDIWMDRCDWIPL